MEIDLKLLQYAVVLARHRHFGRAAAALRISQPTLSRNIATLERQIGMRVFERSHRDVVATPAGDDVLKMADELIARAEALSNRLQLVRDGRGGRLRVAAGAYIHDIAVQPAAIDLIKANPSIRLELLEREWTAVAAMLMTDRIDFAVFDIASLRGMPALRIESLGSLQGVYFCRAGHPLLEKASLQPADMRDYPFVLPSLSNLQAGLIDGLDAGMTLDPATGDVLSSVAVSSFRISRDIVAGTDAIGIGHPSQVKEGLAAGRLALLHLPWRSKLPAAEMGIAYKRERTLPPSARTFINLIRKRVRTVETSRRGSGRST
ncbi:DNA-binding transcriptional regulator, LysR family [Rhodospirillales bacterium URHD0017]|nr:DNA-binding transcriptional regulator, LysR family [Rhodospirillales bacterium URHD0017]